MGFFPTFLQIFSLCPWDNLPVIPDNFNEMIPLKNIPEELILRLFCHRLFCVGLLQVIPTQQKRITCIIP